VAALCPGCKAKSAAANFFWLFEHPDSSACRTGVVPTLEGAMLLKDFPEGFTLGDSVYVLGVMLQSILIHASELIEAPNEAMQAEDSGAFDELLAVLSAALRDAEGLQKKRLN
jgi:hypothetical protein